MSALPPKADMCGATSDVRYGPEAGIQIVVWYDDEAANWGGLIVVIVF